MYVAMRLGPLVRLLVGVAVVSALVLVVIMVQAPAHGAAAPSSTLAAAGALPLFRIARTDGGGLNIRSCPRSSCARVGWLGEGGSFTVDCAATGSAVHGDMTWLMGTGAGRTGYAARYYLAPAAANPADGVPACDRLAAAKG